LIERFLEGNERYPQEWNDFVDSESLEARVVPYRKRCQVLDPLVNCPGEPDPGALNELKTIASLLREMH
jgi:hypothetical protein